MLFYHASVFAAMPDDATATTMPPLLLTFARKVCLVSPGVSMNIIAEITLLRQSQTKFYTLLY